MARRWGIVFLAFALLLYVAAPLVTSNFCYLLAALYLLAAVILLPHGRARVAVELDFPARLTAGHPARVAVRLRARAWRPLLSVVAELQLPEPLRSALAPAAWQLRLLPPRGERVISATLTPPRRGVWPCGGLQLEHYGFAGLAATVTRAGAACELIVHPRSIAELSPRELLSGRLTALGQRYVPARAGEEFHALREYRPGDPLRRIHWRTTARAGELMVIVAETPALETPVLWLDTALPAGPAFEYNVRVAATFVRHLTETTGCSLRAGAARREPGAGAATQVAMLDLLSRVAAGESQPEPGPNAIIVTVPGAAYALAPPAAAIVIVNDLWDAAGDAAPGAIRLTSLGLRRDDSAPGMATGPGAQ